MISTIKFIEGNFSLQTLKESGVSDTNIEKIEQSLRFPSNSHLDKLFYVGLLEVDNKIFISLPKSLSLENVNHQDIVTLFKVLFSVSKNKELVNRIPDGKFLLKTRNDDQLSRLSLAEFIISDYIINGEIEFNTHNQVLGNQYEANWVKTIDKLLPVPNKSGHIFPEWISKRRSKVSDQAIKNIHHYVLNECFNKYGEILGYNKKLLDMHFNVNKIPNHPFKIINSKLRSIYSQRETLLLKALSSWLNKGESSATPEFFGTRFFNLVWEEVCSFLFDNRKNKLEWKDVFHPTQWKFTTTGNIVEGASFNVDIISEILKRKLILADAKYYIFEVNPKAILSVNDISKQLHYEKQLVRSNSFKHKYTEKKNLENIFIFPSNTNVMIQKTCEISFPNLHTKPIQGILLDTRKAFQRYISEKKLSCDELRFLSS